jgi:hypothetical protein
VNCRQAPGTVFVHMTPINYIVKKVSFLRPLAELQKATVSLVTYAYNKTNFMPCLSSVYSVTIHVHVSGLLVVHNQEVTMYICKK